MRRRKQNMGFLGAGLSSILLAFVLLCLVTFAALSLSSAKSDLSFCEQLAEHTRSYYEADSRANRRVMEIDEVLASPYNERKELIEALQGLGDLTVTEDGDRILCSFRESQGEEQDLCAELTLTAEGDVWSYRITGWQTQSTGTWTEEKLHLLTKEK